MSGLLLMHSIFFIFGMEIAPPPPPPLGEGVPAIRFIIVPHLICTSWPNYGFWSLSHFWEAIFNTRAFNCNSEHKTSFIIPRVHRVKWNEIYLGYIKAGGFHYTNSIWAHNPNLVKIHLALIWEIMNQSDQNFAHAMAVQLPWHVQNCGPIGSPG